MSSQRVDRLRNEDQIIPSPASSGSGINTPSSSARSSMDPGHSALPEDLRPINKAKGKVEEYGGVPRLAFDGEEDDEEVEDDGLDTLSEEDVSVEGEDKVTTYVWALVGCASISGLMFGIDTAIISGTLVVIGKDLSGSILTTGQKEFITSATTLGALLGSLMAGIGSDITGRKPVLGVANVVFIAGALCQALAHTVWTMIAGRFIVGLGVGFAACIVPLYIGELAPTRLRGTLMTVNVLAVTAGQVIAYAIGAIFQNVSHGWRYMVALSAAPAVGQLCAMAFLPESPRMLIKQGRHDSAVRVLSKIYSNASPEQVLAKKMVLQANIKQSLKVFENLTFQERLYSVFTVASNRRAMILAAGLQALQQLCGFNSLMYYSSTLFASLGFKNSTAVSSVVAIVNFLFTCVVVRLIDRQGRRAIMLRYLPGMVISLALAAAFFWKLTEHTNHRLVDGTDYSKTWSGLVVGSMMAYVASYAISAGCIPWTVQGEIFRMEVRGIANSLATAINWSGNLVISATFLSLMDAITPSGAFGLYSVVCALGWVFCFFCQPETAGLSLEQVYECFKNDFGVRRSREMHLARESERQRLD